jgi:uncharacterized protein YbjT (DUF2867 family)
MKVLLLGATGRTGRWVLEYALGIGHEVVALVRRPEKIAVASQSLRISRGTPEDSNDVSFALAGCDAVISTLNNNRSSDLPWAKPVSPPMFMVRSIGHTVSVMRARGVRRIVVVTALGAGDSFGQAPILTRTLLRRTNLRTVFADHDAQEALLRDSGLDWTCVRPAILTNRPPIKPLVVSYSGEPRPGLTIGRASVARFLVDILAKPEFFGKAPIVSERCWLW